MDNTTYEKMKKAQENYHPKAMSIPGVHGTSIGIKRVAGEFTEAFAICIHLTKKKPFDDVPENERIPKSIEGFQTDVIEHDQLSPHEDNSKRRPVLGGIQIALGNWFGTLGCIVKDKSDNTVCALSNQHVLDKGSKVFQPKSDPICDQIGDTKRVVLSKYVDGGISTLNAYGVTSTPEIVDIGKVEGTYTITWNDLPYAVRKRGRTTLLTSGNITNLNYSGTRTDGWSFAEQQYIYGDGPTFSQPGDSGSAVVDAKNRVVGLLWGGSTTASVGASSPITNVLQELNIEVVKFQKADAPPAYGETIMGKLETLLCQSVRGRSYWHTYRQHESHVRHLFHQIPRLHAIWLKIPQAELVDAVRNGILEPDIKIPSTLGTQDTVKVLSKLGSALARYIKDNDELKQQINLLYADIAGNIGASWREALSDRDTTTVPKKRARIR